MTRCRPPDPVSKCRRDDSDMRVDPHARNHRHTARQAVERHRDGPCTACRWTRILGERARRCTALNPNEFYSLLSDDPAERTKARRHPPKLPAAYKALFPPRLNVYLDDIIEVEALDNDGGFVEVADRLPLADIAQLTLPSRTATASPTDLPA